MSCFYYLPNFSSKYPPLDYFTISNSTTVKIIKNKIPSIKTLFFFLFFLVVNFHFCFLSLRYGKLIFLVGFSVFLYSMVFEMFIIIIFFFIALFGYGLEIHTPKLHSNFGVSSPESKNSRGMSRSQPLSESECNLQSLQTN